MASNQTSAGVSSQSISVPRTGKCPKCGREVSTHPQIDGLNRPMHDKPFRYSVHAGTQWGRQCAGSGELQS